jgi:hypothetical protein
VRGLLIGSARANSQYAAVGVPQLCSVRAAEARCARKRTEGHQEREVRAQVLICSRVASDSALSTLEREGSGLGGAEIVTSPQPQQGGGGSNV